MSYFAVFFLSVKQSCLSWTSLCRARAHIDMPASASYVMGLKTCSITAWLNIKFYILLFSLHFTNWCIHWLFTILRAEICTPHLLNKNSTHNLLFAFYTRFKMSLFLPTITALRYHNLNIYSLLPTTGFHTSFILVLFTLT